MAFFFNKIKPKPKVSRNTDLLHRYGCISCPLNHAKIDSPKMAATLPGDCRVLFVGEAPDDEEDEQGKPFVGPSGKILLECIPDEFKRYCGFDNVINCRIEGNRDPLPNEIQCCSPRRIKVIEQARPKVIVGIGKFALNWALNTVDLQGMRGRLFLVQFGTHVCHFMATYHPSFVIRTAFNKSRPLTSRFGHCLRMDVQRACKATETLETSSIPDEDEIRSNIVTFNGR